MIKANVGNAEIVTEEIKDYLGKRMHDAKVTSVLVSALVAPLIACAAPEVQGTEPSYVTGEHWKRVAHVSDTPFKCVRFFEVRNARRLPSVLSQRAYAGLLKAALVFSSHPSVNWRKTYPKSVERIESFIRLAGTRRYRRNLYEFNAALFDLDSFEVPRTLWTGIPRQVPGTVHPRRPTISGLGPVLESGARL